MIKVFSGVYKPVLGSSPVKAPCHESLLVDPWCSASPHLPLCLQPRPVRLSKWNMTVSSRSIAFQVELLIFHDLFLFLVVFLSFFSYMVLLPPLDFVKICLQPNFKVHLLLLWWSFCAGQLEQPAPGVSNQVKRKGNERWPLQWHFIFLCLVEYFSNCGHSTTTFTILALFS